MLTLQLFCVLVACAFFVSVKVDSSVKKTRMSDVVGFDDAESSSNEQQEHQNEKQIIDRTSANLLAMPKPGKLMAVGDGAVGKTCFLLCASGESFPEDYIPTVFETPDKPIAFRSKKHDVVLEIGLYDTSSRVDYEKLRILSYTGADVVLVCFNVVNRVSYVNALERFVPEAVKSAPTAYIILLGLKTDLRANEDVRERLKKQNTTLIEREEAETAARKLGIKYCEVSSLADGASVRAVMDKCATVIAERHLTKKNGSGLIGFMKRLFSSG
jgi:small GTP-binding protein